MGRYKLDHSSVHLIVGPSRCGKTSFIRKYLENYESLTGFQPRKIYYVCPFNPDIVDTEYLTEFPRDYADIKDSVFVVDDLVYHEPTLKIVAEFGIALSHHNNCHVILVSQKLFVDSPQYRTVADNACYITIFRLVRGLRALTTLASDVMPTKAGAELFLEAYERATSEPFMYLHVNLCSHSTFDRLLSGLLPEDKQLTYHP